MESQTTKVEDKFSGLGLYAQGIDTKVARLQIMFPNLGGGELSTSMNDKKRKVEREPKIFSKRTRLS